MILNVSGRTDVVAFYSEWFMNRYKVGYIDVRNPVYPKQVSRIYFNDVDAIIFCTKNPLPIIKYLKDIDKPILFHVTLTPYKKDLEPNVIFKGRIIEGIKKVSEIIGAEYTYVRYDPVIVNDGYTISYHQKAFDKMCHLLKGYVKHIIISFVDDYKNVRHHKSDLRIKNLTDDDYREIGESFFSSAKECGMSVQTCAEEHNLTEYGFLKEDCLSHTLAFKLTGKTGFKTWRERKCRCVSMVDIGVYNSCSHFCKYCYANYDEGKVKMNYKNHNPNSSLLVGNLEENDIIKVRKS